MKINGNQKKIIIELSNHYDDEFFLDQINGSYESAKIYLDILYGVLDPESVADFGCGRGAWLKAFKERGAKSVVGFDGPWNSHDKMLDSAIEFHTVDLNKAIELKANKSFDLSMSLEVAEHLQVESSKTFIESLTRASDVVMFGSAYTDQGGTNHINEQPHSYWAEIFRQYNYVVFDLFRPKLWGDKRIEFWYQQNTFLYVLKDSKKYDTIIEKGYKTLDNLLFLDCIHPQLYKRYIERPKSKVQLLKLFASSLLGSMGYKN